MRYFASAFLFFSFSVFSPVFVSAGAPFAACCLRHRAQSPTDHSLPLLPAIAGLVSSGAVFASAAFVVVARSLSFVDFPFSFSFFIAPSVARLRDARRHRNLYGQNPVLPRNPFA